MKILVITQTIDNADPVLGFFHDWVKAFAPHFEKITVICLKKGSYSLPENVSVLSLGKEEKISRLLYLYNFYKHIYRTKEEYESVFVHMNQEYILLGFPFWGIFGKHVCMWRNHPAGNFLTKIAVLLCDRTFCTSQFSYINQFKKNELMPVGVDTDFFSSDGHKPSRDILFLSRIAPIKRPDLLVAALGKLLENGRNFSATFVGDPLPKDAIYYEGLKSETQRLGLGSHVLFSRGVPNHQTVGLYRDHKIFVNLSPSGMYDKTIFEAFSSGALCLSSNENLKGKIDGRLLFEEGNETDLVLKLKTLLDLPEAEYLKLQKEVREYTVHDHSLKALVSKLVIALGVAQKTRPFVGTVLRYVISGVIAASVDLFFLFLFTSIFHVWYLLSAVFAFLIAFGVSFVLQKFWTFRDGSTQNIKSQMMLYFVITSFNLALNTLLMYLLVNFGHVPYIIAQMIAGMLVAMQSFFTYQKFIFKN